MKLATYRSEHGPRVAAILDDGLVDLNNADTEIPSCIKMLLSQGAEGLGRAAAAAANGKSTPLDQVQLLAPVPNPEKVICIGLNYTDHAKESGFPIPTEPAVFCKFPTTIRASGDAIMLPRLSPEVDYEAEFVVVIGRGGRHIPKQRALEHVAGYCCGNDVSARDWQLHKPGGQWLLGKSFDGFAPYGPALVTADEVLEPGNLRIQLRLDGQTMQDSNTSQLIFPVEELIAYISGVCTLTPGDIIFTGTPAGVGCSRKPPIFLQPGNVLEVEIEKLGILRNSVVAESV